MSKVTRDSALSPVKVSCHVASCHMLLRQHELSACMFVWPNVNEQCHP